MGLVKVASVYPASHDNANEAPDDTEPVCRHHAKGLTKGPTKPTPDADGQHQTYFFHTGYLVANVSIPCRWGVCLSGSDN